MESKKQIKKWINKSKSHRYREQTDSSRGERSQGRREIDEENSQAQIFYYKINEPQIWSVQSGEYSQYLCNIFAQRQMATSLMVIILKCTKVLKHYAGYQELTLFSRSIILWK